MSMHNVRLMRITTLGALGFVTMLARGVCAQPPETARPSRLVITEIMYNPDSKEDQGQAEWVEIANVGDETVEVVDWRLDDEDKSDWGRFSCVLKPGGIVVLVNADYVDERQFRAAWDPQDPSNAPLSYQVIPVAWGGIANSPSRNNEVLQLRNAADEVVCEVRQEGEWPDCANPDGASIALIDLTVTTLSNPAAWKKSVLNENGARSNSVTEVFGGHDIGSPGFVPGLSASGDPAGARPSSAPSSQPATTRPSNTIDY